MGAEWRPCGLLSGHSTSPYAVLILNQPINENAFDAVIDGCSLLVCADAGADRLFEYQKTSRAKFKHRLPDAIVGDLDSLSSEVEQYYCSNGVEIAKDPSQYATDFTKSLRWIRQRSSTVANIKTIDLDVVVFGGLGGRVDQGFSQIHHLYMAINDRELLQGRLYLLSEQSMTFVLENNINTIFLEPGYFDENVGVIPILGSCHITTKGFEWDVHNWMTEFGGQISTSNHVRANELQVEVVGKRPLLTLELAQRFTAVGDRVQKILNHDSP